MKVRVPSPRDEEVFLRRRCECVCGGNGLLVFYRCGACGRVVLVCDEVGNIFPEPLDPTRGNGWIHDDTGACPSCGRTHVRDFLRATVDEVVALGFAVADLETVISDEALQR